ncbi:hypothetical protein NEOLEDRAFT_154560 [Neolentinus lepideus HHB14362 ss-1]|uniref:Uncharacterized protein n=1 Tax=Neolentinus lepideus HHB14362 ss-1 TaxID=1314782 RepID=A0A165ML57_9AGAM|nr:hypothetical protein NEOLEDRAFT_154560 [Neolentinus lepideus HHB14362 ss-1]
MMVAGRISVYTLPIGVQCRQRGSERRWTTSGKPKCTNGTGEPVKDSGSAARPQDIGRRTEFCIYIVDLCVMSVTQEDVQVKWKHGRRAGRVQCAMHAREQSPDEFLYLHCPLDNGMRHRRACRQQQWPYAPTRCRLPGGFLYIYCHPWYDVNDMIGWSTASGQV